MVKSLSESRSFRPERALSRTAFFCFALYLSLLLGTNSVAEMGGALTWLPLWRLPAADGRPAVVGIVSLLPPLAVIAWLGARAVAGTWRGLHAGWGRVAWPLLSLVALGFFSLLLPCLGGACRLTAVIRLLVLALHVLWVYFYVVNEKVDLLPIIVAVILIQSAVAIAQFVRQGDLGLSFLGESVLDPQVSGISVVMRGPARWLRAYGFATHPNDLAVTLVSLMLIIPVISRGATPARRRIGGAVFTLGFAAVLTTLSRWAGICLALGLGVNLLPWVRESLRTRRRIPPPLGAGTWIALLLVGALFFAVYGDTVVGRVARLDTPIESRSLNERSRDTAISLRLIAAHPSTGVGLGEYVTAARTHDAWAEAVHAVPLLLTAEMGLAAGVIWTWLAVGPFLRRGALGRFAPETGLWLAFWSLGLLGLSPNPLYELRSALLVGLVAAVVAARPGGEPEEGSFARTQGLM